MELDVTNELEQKVPVSPTTIKGWLTEELKEQGRDTRYYIEVVWVSETRMAALNKKYRHKDAPTDVLSFPVENNRIKGALNTTKPLGSIVLCLPVITQQAKDANATLKDELERMVKHSLRHLIGLHHR